jgi:hypothetical protein
MIHDAFQPVSYWNGFMPYPEYEGVILDTHIYEMFSVSVSIFLWTFIFPAKLTIMTG